MTALRYLSDDDSFESYARFLRRANELVYGSVYKPPALAAVRHLTDRQNPLEYYNEVEFLARYRFSKRAVVAIMAELQLHTSTDNRGAPLPALLKVLIALRFYGTGAMQTVRLRVQRDSVCFLAFNHITVLLYKLCKQVFFFFRKISFPRHGKYTHTEQNAHQKKTLHQPNCPILPELLD